MKEKIARLFEDTYYAALIRIRRVLERLHILHPPTEEQLQKATDAMLIEFDETTRYLEQQYQLALAVDRQDD